MYEEKGIVQLIKKMDTSAFCSKRSLRAEVCRNAHSDVPEENGSVGMPEDWDGQEGEWACVIKGNIFPTRP